MEHEDQPTVRAGDDVDGEVGAPMAAGVDVVGGAVRMATDGIAPGVVVTTVDGAVLSGSMPVRATEDSTVS